MNRTRISALGHCELSAGWRSRWGLSWRLPRVGYALCAHVDPSMFWIRYWLFRHHYWRLRSTCLKLRGWASSCCWCGECCAETLRDIQPSVTHLSFRMEPTSCRSRAQITHHLRPRQLSGTPTGWSMDRNAPPSGSWTGSNDVLAAIASWSSVGRDQHPQQPRLAQIAQHDSGQVCVWCMTS